MMSSETTADKDNTYSIEQRDEQLVGSGAAIRYHCHFHRAAQHLLCVEMEIDAVGAELTLVMPSWIPGSYKVRDFVSHQGDLVVTDASGRALPFAWVTKSRLRIRCGDDAGSIRVSYTYYANERTVRTMHINRWRAFINPANCMMYVEGRQQEIHHVILHHDAREWRTVSTALSPVPHLTREDGPIVVGALNYDILIDSPIEVGNHLVGEFEAFGARHEVALVSAMTLDVSWITQQCKTIVEKEGAMFGGVPYDRYVFMIQVGSNIFGGLEHARCSVNMIDYTAITDTSSSGRLLALLCHEYFHTWNVKRIRPVEYGPFDYDREVYSPMLLLAEGFTSYYDDLFSYRCGFMEEPQYLKTLAEEHLGRLDEVRGRFAMSTRDASMLAWVKLYAQSPDGNNRHPSYYLKGGVITLLLDLHIIHRTNGTRSLDDVMRELWDAYERRPGRGFTETEVYEAVQRATGCDVQSLMEGWLNGTEELDYGIYLAPFGLRWTRTSVDGEWSRQSVALGMGLKEESGRLIVTTVTDATPAQRAGLSIDDEIIAVNGIRTASASMFMDIVAVSAGPDIEILACCDGRTYMTSLQRERKVRYSMSIIENAGPEAQRLRDFWLRR
ncbi:MAG: M61 family metallopeptidase [Candidatus Kapaibacterium sp.]